MIVNIFEQSLAVLRLKLESTSNEYWKPPMSDKMKNKELLSSVNESRREFVGQLVKTSAFAVPMALGLGTLTARKVYAQANSSENSGGAQSSSGGPGGPGDPPASVPEPTAVVLLGLGLASMALHARNKKKSSTN